MLQKTTFQSWISFNNTFLFGIVRGPIRSEFLLKSPVQCTVQRNSSILVTAQNRTHVLYTFLLRMTDTMSYQNTDLSSWDTLCMCVFCSIFNILEKCFSKFVFLMKYVLFYIKLPFYDELLVRESTGSDKHKS
jgi:hypothetical protein